MSWDTRDERLMMFIVRITLIELEYHDKKLIQKNFTIEEPAEKVVHMVYHDVFIQLVFEDNQGVKYHHKWFNN